MEEPRKHEVVLTVGHSNRPLAEFLDLLRAHGVERVVDVRTMPRSRHNPQFNSDALEGSLRDAQIAYTHLKSLGGLRHARADSQNLGWRNASFRGYADYMQTAEFEESLARLLELASHERCAIMCAEAVPWRCHRSLIGDALTARGIRVENIMSATKRDAHHLTSFARVCGNRVTYPADKGPADKGPADEGPADEGPADAGTGDTGEPGASKTPSLQGQLALEYGPPPMPKKRKPKFTAANEARRRAREAAGTPPPARVIPDKRAKSPKHKKPLKDDSGV